MMFSERETRNPGLCPEYSESFLKEALNCGRGLCITEGTACTKSLWLEGMSVKQAL